MIDGFRAHSNVWIHNYATRLVSSIDLLCALPCRPVQIIVDPVLGEVVTEGALKVRCGELIDC